MRCALCVNRGLVAVEGGDGGGAGVGGRGWDGERRMRASGRGRDLYGGAFKGAFN